MANTHQRAQEIGEAAVELSNRLKAVLKDVTGFLQHNSALAINWSGDPKPAFLNEDAAGNLDGLHFTRTDLANAINSFAQFKSLLTGQAVAQGDYLGNLEKLAKADA
jgi:predicted ABC-type transport system involved in lysophospholipase L1 biosynthesis ATPase subunit